ncbi:MAG: hypothetical protein QM534_17820 [Sediminibacterium sp.]|nr:hypothetical protein [Sediminibacterium sp.]
MDKQQHQKTVHKSSYQETKETTGLLLYSLISSGNINLTVFEKSILKVYYSINDNKDDRRYTHYVKPDFRPLYLEQAMNKVTQFIASIPNIVQDYKKINDENAVLREQLEKQQNYILNLKSINPETLNVLNTLIWETSLPTRVKTVCLRYGYNYVKDLTKLAPDKICIMSGMGKNGLNAIEQFWKEHKLNWGMSLE